VLNGPHNNNNNNNNHDVEMEQSDNNNNNIQNSLGFPSFLHWQSTANPLITQNTQISQKTQNWSQLMRVQLLSMRQSAHFCRTEHGHHYLYSLCTTEVVPALHSALHLRPHYLALPRSTARGDGDDYYSFDTLHQVIYFGFLLFSEREFPGHMMLATELPFLLLYLRDRWDIDLHSNNNNNKYRLKAWQRIVRLVTQLRRPYNNSNNNNNNNQRVDHFEGNLLEKAANLWLSWSDVTQLLDPLINNNHNQHNNNNNHKKKERFQRKAKLTMGLLLKHDVIARYHSRARQQAILLAAARYINNHHDHYHSVSSAYTVHNKNDHYYSVARCQETNYRCLVLAWYDLRDFQQHPLRSPNTIHDNNNNHHMIPKELAIVYLGSRGFDPTHVLQCTLLTTPTSSHTPSSSHPLAHTPSVVEIEAAKQLRTLCGLSHGHYPGPRLRVTELVDTRLLEESAVRFINSHRYSKHHSTTTSNTTSNTTSSSWWDTSRMMNHYLHAPRYTRLFSELNTILIENYHQHSNNIHDGELERRAAEYLRELVTGVAITMLH
jgi:hypothetical protein